LVAALVVDLTQRSTPPGRIRVTAFEVDSLLLPHLTEVLDACRRLCRRAGTAFAADVRGEDFVGAAVGMLGARRASPVDVALLNPPYKKITTASHAWRRIA